MPVDEDLVIILEQQRESEEQKITIGRIIKFCVYNSHKKIYFLSYEQIWHSKTKIMFSEDLDRKSTKS